MILELHTQYIAFDSHPLYRRLAPICQESRRVRKSLNVTMLQYKSLWIVMRIPTRT